MGKLAVLLFFLLCSSFASGQSLQEYFTLAQEAYQQKEYDTYLEYLISANEMRPNHPVIVYRLAGAYALNNRKTRAIQTLNQMLLMDATIDFNGDDDFASIRARRGYDKLIELQKELNRIEENDEVFIEVDAAELHPESFVILEDGTLLMGSIREKRIVKVLADGNYVNWLETPFSVMGMKVDSITNTLWVATAAIPEMMDYSEEQKGYSTLLQVDLNTGFIIQGMQYDEGSLIGDLQPDSNQKLWFTNSMEPYLNRDDTDTTSVLGTFTRLSYDLYENFINLQGLTLSEDEKYLYFSDYIKGLFRVDIEEGDITPVLSNSATLLKGIDGVYTYKNTLIAIHNGTKPNKVVQYFLNEEGTFIEFERVINRGGADLGEPTLGQVKDGYFYYLANSPWAAYENGEFNVSSWGKIQIRRIKLD